MKKLNNNDLNISAELFANSQITNNELSSKIKIAPSTCLERVKHLQFFEVLKVFRLELDCNAIGGRIEAMTLVRLGKYCSEVSANFRKNLMQYP